MQPLPNAAYYSGDVLRPSHIKGLYATENTIDSATTGGSDSLVAANADLHRNEAGESAEVDVIHSDHVSESRAAVVKEPEKVSRPK